MFMEKTGFAGVLCGAILLSGAGSVCAGGDVQASSSFLTAMGACMQQLKQAPHEPELFFIDLPQSLAFEGVYLNKEDLQGNIIPAIRTFSEAATERFVNCLDHAVERFGDKELDRVYSDEPDVPGAIQEELYPIYRGAVSKTMEQVAAGTWRLPRYVYSNNYGRHYILDTAVPEVIFMVRTPPPGSTEALGGGEYNDQSGCKDSHGNPCGTGYDQSTHGYKGNN